MTTSFPATEAELRAALIAESSDVCAAPDILARVHGDGASPERGGGRSWRWLAPVAVAVAVAAAAVVLATTSGRGQSHPAPVGEPSGTVSTPAAPTTAAPTTATPTTVTPTTAAPVELVPTNLGGLTLRHPATWHHVPNQFPDAGPSGTIGFLSNEPIIAQCTSVGAARNCVQTVAKLASGGVLVGVSARFMGQNTIHANTAIAGYPAELTRLTQSDLSTDCPAGATYALGAAINVPHSTIYVSACAADDTAASRDAIAAMFATATYEAVK